MGSIPSHPWCQLWFYTGSFFASIAGSPCEENSVGNIPSAVRKLVELAGNYPLVNYPNFLKKHVLTTEKLTQI
jgi:hypothetical protein